MRSHEQYIRFAMRKARRYTQEVMAEFGEEEMGVYQKRFINAAIMEGERLKFRYITKFSLFY